MWVRKTQEKGGDYWFNGICYLTATINQTIPKQEIITILQDLHSFVESEQGIDYLQVYTNQETGQVIWIIDQVTRQELKRGVQPAEHNYYTILFPDEY